jgi:AcrR family transcriptional regulator
MVPKIVDHDQRRRDIIQATWQVIAREGIANATTREIAKEAGCSLGILVHYFKDKAEIMATAMLAAHDVVNDRDDDSVRGLAALRTYMLECMPLDARRQFLTVIEASFWGQAVGNQRLIDLNSTEIESFRRRIKAKLQQARADGELKPDVDIASVVIECHVLMDGLSIQAALYPKSASKRQQLALLDAIIDRIRVAPQPAAIARARRTRSAVNV